MAGGEIPGGTKNNNNDNVNLEPISLTKLVTEIRADGKVDHEELTKLLNAYEDRRGEIHEGVNAAFMAEKQIADTLFEESFEDMFEEYEVRGKEDIGRLERLLNIINPIRLAKGKVAVSITQEVKDYYKNPENESKKPNIMLNTKTGTLGLQPWYRGWFTREGTAKVSEKVETLSKEVMNKMEKMLQSTNNLMRGSVDDFRQWLNEKVEKGILDTETPESKALKKLDATKVPSLGDFHLGQLETIDGKVRISDIDEASKDSPLKDAIRTIASIFATSGAYGQQNVAVFLSDLKQSLDGRSVNNDKIPKNMKPDPEKPETQESILNIKFIKASPEGKFDDKVTRVSDGEKKSIETILGKPIIDSRSDLSDGVGSAGKRKILVTVKEESVIRVYEFKQQDGEVSKNQERADVAAMLNGKEGVIRAVSLDDKPYTLKEIVPGYRQYDPDTGTPEDRTWASKATAIELAKLWSTDPETRKNILAELIKTDVQDALKKLGEEYATRMSDGLRRGREEYPELINRTLLEKNKKFLQENKDTYNKLMLGIQDGRGNELSSHMESIQIYTEANNGTEVRKEINTLHELINVHLKLDGDKKLNTSKGEMSEKTLKSLQAIIDIPKSPTVTVTAPQENPTLAKKYEQQVATLEKFYNENRGFKGGFMEKLEKNNAAYNALAEILGVGVRKDGYLYQSDIQEATRKVQESLKKENPKIQVDKAFGPDTLRAWKQSDNYGKRMSEMPKK